MTLSSKPAAVLAWSLLVAAPLLGAPACAGEDCVDVSTSCEPLYEPTFDNVWQNTLVTSCAVGSTCHSAGADRGGLTLDDADRAYDELLGNGGDDPRVSPGDPGCSEVIRRLVSDDSGEVMPPGSALSEAERCAVIQWVANGAER
ncbi:MAG: c-type cytochrome domain-containing protein [Polyangiaceae bacterium]